MASRVSISMLWVISILSTVCRCTVCIASIVSWRLAAVWLAFIWLANHLSAKVSITVTNPISPFDMSVAAVLDRFVLPETHSVDYELLFVLRLQH